MKQLYTVQYNILYYYTVVYTTNSQIAQLYHTLAHGLIVQHTVCTYTVQYSTVPYRTFDRGAIVEFLESLGNPLVTSALASGYGTALDQENASDKFCI